MNEQKSARKYSGLWETATFLLSTVIFLIDIFTPTGVVEGFLYLFVILITLWIPGGRITVIAACATAILIILGFFISPQGVTLTVSATNRLFAIFGIIITMYIVLKNKRKEMLLRERNEQLGKIVMELKISNSDLEQFAYVASHDLQEPLRNITNYIGLLKNQLTKNIDEKTSHSLIVIVKSAEKMKILIRDLLFFSLIGKSRVVEKVDCNKMLKEILTDLDFSIRESKAKIIVDNLPLIDSNRTEIRQLLQNLISNALKFKKKNIAPEIHMHCEDKNTEWEFSVSDNGIGIQEEYIHKIFSIFQRLHSKDEYPGTGIGLAICKKIIEINGGKIWVSSKLNIGSTFYFTIPKNKPITHEKTKLYSTN